LFAPVRTASSPDASAELLRELARGDLQAMRAIYDAHEVAVRAFAQRLVGDSDAAEDLVQEVFVALPDAIRSFRGGSTLRTFLLGITANRAHQHVRSAARRRASLASLAREASLHDEPARPDAYLHRRELAETLTRALDTLPHDQRVAFVLCVVEERSSLEAGEIVGANEGAVRARVMLARNKLRALLEKRGVR
jgi:RNA polymerase sigma-70 factor (ECF subfamily)